MNDSTFEAIMIGVNTIIFMVALTAGMKLMGTINDMVEYSNQAAAAVSSGNLIQAYGDTVERIYSGVEVYDIYRQCKENGGKLNNNITVQFKINGSTYNVDNYGSRGLNNLYKEFKLKYTAKDKIIFETI